MSGGGPDEITCECNKPYPDPWGDGWIDPVFLALLNALSELNTRTPKLTEWEHFQLRWQLMQAFLNSRGFSGHEPATVIEEYLRTLVRPPTGAPSPTIDWEHKYPSTYPPTDITYPNPVPPFPDD